MHSIRYVEIENFKTFSGKLHVDLGHPAVLIGPNNAGKTSIIQALALWSRGVKAWYENKGEPRKQKRERLSAGMNRLNILDVPVLEARMFWNENRVRRGNSPIEMVITVGIELNGITKDCRMIFTYRDSEIIYCKPCPVTVQDDELLKHAAEMQFHLLYPMSGIMSGISPDTEETPLPDGRINLYLGQGQTAQVLRNICYKVISQQQTGEQDWEAITDLINKMFLVELKKPVFNEARGSLVMTYRQKGVDSELDISLAGRGLQQVLLILAYLYWNKRSILLVDEPDAHLEILRQRQIYEILKIVAEQNSCQVIIATHSEVILDDAVDINLTLLLNGEAVNLAKQQDMKNALRSIGIEHYYKAKVSPRILYVEGSTDIEILKALAKKLNHPAFEILSGNLNYYYTQNVSPENNLENRLDRAAGAYGNIENHFHTLRKFVPEFKGIAIFDNDNRDLTDKIDENLAIVYWKEYELENYFISLDVLRLFAKKQFGEDNLWERPLADFNDVIDQCLLNMVFKGDIDQLQEFKSLSTNLQRTLLKNTKMSTFTEEVFSRFARQQSQPILLNKGQYYRLVDFMNTAEISNEVRDKLDLIVKYLTIVPAP